MKKIFFNHIFLLTVFLTVACRLTAQTDPQILWENTIGGTDYEEATTSFATSDGGVIIGGSSTSDISLDKSENSKGSYDFWILKLNSNGIIQWQKTIGGNSDDMLTSMLQTSDGGYIIGGYSLSTISGDKTEYISGNDFWVLKLDSSGAIQWQNTIGGADQDYLYNICQTTDGGYILGGASNSSISGDKTEMAYAFSLDYWVVKINSVGVVQWDNTFGGTDYDLLTDVSSTADGGAIIGGHSASNISPDKLENEIGYDDYWVVKLDSNGVIEWENTIGGAYAELLQSIQQTTDGGYILGGYSSSEISFDKTEPTFGTNDYWIVKLNASGAIMWQKDFGGTADDYLYSVKQTIDGAYILVGSSLSGQDGNKSEINYGFNDYWILKIDSLGDVLWQNTINSDGDEYTSSVCQTNDGDYVITGTSLLSTAFGDKSESSDAPGDYWILKLKNPIGQISGNVYADINTNCIKDLGSDIGIQNRIISDIYFDNNAISDANGDYHFPIFKDTTMIFLSNLPAEDTLSCFTHDTLTIYSSSLSPIDTIIDFPLQGSTFCHHLNVSIAAVPMRICTMRDFIVQYQNLGFDTALSAFIIIEIDTTVLDSVYSTYPYTQNGDSLIFPLGNLSPFANGAITFSAFINCSAVLGSSICTRAFIYPLNNCFPSEPASDGSDIEVAMSCSADTIRATIKNTSLINDMTHQGIIIAIEDEIIQRIDSFMLPGGISTQFKYTTAPNKTLTLQVHQDPNHQIRPIIITQDELCSLSLPIILNSVVNDFSRFDDAEEYEELCLPIVGSYDPNLKSVSPQGLTTQHFTDKNQILEYRIDFQNTGTDTAFKVVVIDTLNRWLDIKSFVPLVSSHNYSTIFEGARTVKFIFDPIALPDSNASEANSHGYVTFKIKPKSNTPKGTIINNYADIYFDRNDPVQTNTIFNMIYDTVLINLGTAILDVEALQSNIVLFPNPANEKFYIRLDNELNKAKIVFSNILGQEIFEMNQVNGNVVEMNATGVSKGIYLINIYEQNKLFGRSKVVLQ